VYAKPIVVPVGDGVLDPSCQSVMGLASLTADADQQLSDEGSGWREIEPIL
jgi:hypothetical protein